jgi:hypothetical protein
MATAPAHPSDPAQAVPRPAQEVVSTPKSNRSSISAAAVGGLVDTVCRVMSRFALAE